MKANRRTLYKLLRYKRVVDIYRDEFRKGMTDIGFWENYVLPILPISYDTYRKALSESNIDGQLAELEEQGYVASKRKENVLKNQLKLFNE